MTSSPEGGLVIPAKAGIQNDGFGIVAFSPSERKSGGPKGCGWIALPRLFRAPSGRFNHENHQMTDTQERSEHGLSRFFGGSRRVWDITLPLRAGMTVWPGDPEVTTAPVADIGRGDPCNVTALGLGSHTGTHLDPPRHFYADGPALEEIPIDRLIGPCTVLDLTDVSSSISAERLAAASIPESARRILLKTANSQLWEDPRHEFRPDFVDLSIEGAEWLVNHGISLVGIDYLSIEGPANPEHPVHRALLGAGILILEGLDLRATPSGDYQMICLPLRTINGDGAPTRVLLSKE